MRQGDTLAPFLYLVLAEDIARFVEKVVSKGAIIEYKVSNSLSYPLLQFAKDAIFLCGRSWENILSIKIHSTWVRIAAENENELRKKSYYAH